MRNLKFFIYNNNNCKSPIQLNGLTTHMLINFQRVHIVCNNIITLAARC